MRMVGCVFEPEIDQMLDCRGSARPFRLGGAPAIDALEKCRGHSEFEAFIGDASHHRQKYGQMTVVVKPMVWFTARWRPDPAGF